jgi:hypothetical protein
MSNRGQSVGPIASHRLARLREAIRHGEVSFPASVPSFARQYCEQTQWRVASLYFVRGWTADQLAARYQVTSSRIRQSLRRWVECAATLGYLQEIGASGPSTPARSPLGPAGAQCFRAMSSSAPKTATGISAIAI